MRKKFPGFTVTGDIEVVPTPWVVNWGVVARLGVSKTPVHVAVSAVARGAIELKSVVTDADGALYEGIVRVSVPKNDSFWNISGRKIFEFVWGRDKLYSQGWEFVGKKMFPR
jgi:hypothetical protein